MTSTLIKKHKSISLREVINSDREIFFQQQLDPEANFMAAFTAKDPSDREAYDAKMDKILKDDTITIKTILFNEEVAGSVLCHGWFGDPEVSYWIGQEFWGKGITTRALSIFLKNIDIRPLYARVVKDNIGSIKVLEKCGFVPFGEDRGFANARGEEVDELIFVLR